MNVLWVSHSAGLAGAERALLEGVKGLSSQPISINVVVPSGGPLVPALASLRVPVSVLPYAWWMSPSGWRSHYYRTAHCARNFAVWPKVLRFLRNLKPDLVVSNTLTIPIWGLASKHLGLPHVWYVHESGTAEGDGFDLGDRRTFKLMDALSTLIIVNSESARSGLNQRIPAEKIRLATYAVETPTGLDCATADANVFRMALVGRVSQNKGQAEAIEAMYLLVRQSMNVNLKIIGNTDSPFSRHLRQRINDLGLEANVELVPFSDSPFQHVIDADLALMCSHKETFGRVTIEAMKMGKPVVGAAIDATRELIQDGFNGLLYQAGNVKDLAAKITTLYYDRAKLTSMGEKARAWSTQRFTIEGYSNDLSAIFEEAISKHINHTQAQTNQTEIAGLMHGAA